MTRSFYKMTGSGNDFVFVDARQADVGDLTSADRIRAICARGTGVGADGIVFLDRAPDADVGIRYFNSDGTPAALCGNATLCTVRLAADLGLARAGDLRIATGAGVLEAHLVDGVPEFDLGALDRVTSEVPVDRETGERRIGFGVAGVPQLVVLVDDVESVDVARRGRRLRSHPWPGPAGANVNFVSPAPARPGDGSGGPGGQGSHDAGEPGHDWMIRTYERGVEGETLACGSGAVVTAALLTAWGTTAAVPVRLWTRSGAPLCVSVRCVGDRWNAALRGEGRLVFRGELADV
jgi:diaminopimelate epimerase